MPTTAHRQPEPSSPQPRDLRRWSWAVSLGLLIIIVLVNIFGVEFYGRSEASVTIVMMITFAILAVVGSAGAGEALGWATPRPENAGLLPEGGWATVFGSVGVAIWFFIGFEFACPMAEENKKPYKNIPYGLIFGLITIYDTPTGSYLLSVRSAGPGMC